MRYTILHFLRSLRRHKAFTAINFGGLTIGITAALLLFRYVRHEYAYDRQSPYVDQIWRVYNYTADCSAVMTKDANTHSAVGPTLQRSLPEVADFARLYCGSSPEVVVLADQKPFEWQKCYMTDPGFLRLFPQTILQGNPNTCLNQPGQALITQSQAKRLFGEGMVLGKTFRISDGMMAGLYTVTAVVADPPRNTHLKFDALLSYSTRYASGHEDNFDSYWDYNYLLLNPGANPEKVRQKLREISQAELKDDGITLDIQRFTDIHLHSDLTYELEPNSKVKTVQFLGLIGLLILGIALINYVNLASAFAQERAKEVGIRKAIGANRTQLIGQFLSEHLILCCTALGLATGLYHQTLPWFDNLAGIEPSNSSDPAFWMISLGIVLFMALAAGWYPALLMSGYQPAQALRGRFGRLKGGFLRKSLVTTQFLCSAGLIFGVLVVNRQLQFLRQYELGVSLDQMVSLRLSAPRDSLTGRKLSLLQQKCAQIPGISGSAFSSITPGLGINGISGSNRPLRWTQLPEYARISSYFVETDEHFFPLFGVKVLAGEHRFHPNPEARFRHVTLNETMRKALGFSTPEAAIGQEIAYENSEGGATMKVGAVVEDFHIESLKHTPRPTLYYCFAPEDLRYLTLKIHPHQLSQALGSLQTVWAELFPDQPLTYWFLDEHFAQQYRQEARFESVFGIFAGLAIALSCMGLLGLTAFQVQRRKKEIGIRKVLGAGTLGLIGLLMKDFLKLVLLALALASPLAAWLMQLWLEGYAYRIGLDAWMFVATGLLVLIFALGTVCLQSFKAAADNPVNSLRDG
ncbi:MAG: ABC transporter permease [Saprospiraceae bacterium]|nr:ABC transporter permease [Saprospiraceae bacterium]